MVTCIWSVCSWNAQATNWWACHTVSDVRYAFIVTLFYALLPRSSSHHRALPVLAVTLISVHLLSIKFPSSLNSQTPVSIARTVLCFSWNTALNTFKLNLCYEYLQVAVVFIFFAIFLHGINLSQTTQKSRPLAHSLHPIWFQTWNTGIHNTSRGIRSRWT